MLSGGNFHAEPVAFAADNLALAIAEIGALAERRIAMLIDDSLSQLPAFLVRQGGLNSGFMIAQVTAAALASENKSLAHPASVDSLPTSANQEDHVSMATFAARRLGPMAENTRGVIAIELLAAAQGIDFRRPLGSSPALEKAHALLRAKVAFYDHDRHLRARHCSGEVGHRLRRIPLARSGWPDAKSVARRPARGIGEVSLAPPELYRSLGDTPPPRAPVARSDSPTFAQRERVAGDSERANVRSSERARGVPAAKCSRYRGGCSASHRIERSTRARPEGWS